MSHIVDRNSLIVEIFVLVWFQVVFEAVVDVHDLLVDFIEQWIAQHGFKVQEDMWVVDVVLMAHMFITRQDNVSEEHPVSEEVFVKNVMVSHEHLTDIIDTFWVSQVNLLTIGSMVNSPVNNITDSTFEIFDLIHPEVVIVKVHFPEVWSHCE